MNAVFEATSLSATHISQREHAPEGEGAVSGFVRQASDDDYENVPTRHRFKDRFRELTFPGNPSSGYQGLRATYRVGDFLRWIRAVLS